MLLAKDPLILYTFPRQIDREPAGIIDLNALSGNIELIQVVSSEGSDTKKHDTKCVQSPPTCPPHTRVGGRHQSDLFCMWMVGFALLHFLSLISLYFFENTGTL